MNRNEPTPFLVEKTLSLYKHSTPDVAREMLNYFVELALTKTLTWNKNIIETLKQKLSDLDALISQQLSAIMHHPDLLQLEGSWRGLSNLIQQPWSQTSIKFKLFSLTKSELIHSLNAQTYIEHSTLYKLLYENEYDMPGGEPYSVLIGDYYFAHTPAEISCLSKIAKICATAFCPFISAASPDLFSFDDWRELTIPADLDKIFTLPAYTAWRHLRTLDESRFLSLTLPRTLARTAYHSLHHGIEEFNYDECVEHHRDYCWMNSAYLYTYNILKAFDQFGTTTAIRGMEGGGKIKNLPLHRYVSEAGDLKPNVQQKP